MNKSKDDDVCNEIVYQKIFFKHSEELFKFYSYKYMNTHGIEDIIQDAYIKLWDNCAKVEIDKARAYLYKVVNNAILNEKKHLKVVHNYENQHTSSEDNITPSHVLEEKEFSVRLQSALDDLSEPQRVAFLMNRIDGKKHQEIADELGISKKAVEKRIYGALNNLRKTIKEL
ncbi:MAG: RNA polymerase sigma factor [Nonlabens sp.]|uniref:RNA polymerase sigma factor n=1 Tax=Nonlabens sp. TaxID=1888209 RepID=UPI003EFA9134